MTIIRNERTSRQARDAQSDSQSAEELDIDYRWHPTDDEYVSPLTAEQWAELLGDDSFTSTDPYKAIVCLREYGAPATFQQLSIKYRGTMGRYRRWLSDAAQTAGQRFGLSAPMQNQFGMDEWWPLLYFSRATGKPGAGVFEMRLRDEVEAGFKIIDEKEKLAKRAENARQLQRIEQLERARKEERDRLAAEAAKAAKAAKEARARATAQKAEEPAPVTTSAEQPEPVQQAMQIPEQNDSPKETASTQAEAPKPQEEITVTPKPVAKPAVMPAAKPSGKSAATRKTSKPSEPVPQAEKPATKSFPALRSFLDDVATALEQRRKEKKDEVLAFDVTASVDYALRYADRLRQVFLRMQQGNPNFTAAAVARELGDESVERLQNMLNGQGVPSFAYLDKLRDRLFVNVTCLEVPDGRESAVPSFLSLQEYLGKKPEVERLFNDELTQIAYVVDDSDDRRTGVVFAYGPLRCALLTREAVEGKVKHGSKARLNAYSKMVGELDKYAREHDVERGTRKITAEQWDGLVAGTLWAGAVI